MVSRRSFIASGLVLGLVLGLPPGTAQAQGAPWPSRPIRFIVPLTPGGANDILARVFAERLQPALGQPVVVENRPGAGGNVGTEYVAKQQPDGYTLLLSSNTHVINPSLYAKLPYDPIKDFEPVTLVATIPFVLTVNSSLPVTTLPEFIAYLKSHPGSTYATAGNGTPHHLGAELLRTMTGVDITHVPYKGAASLVPALLAGDVTFSIASMSSLVPHFKSGRLRAIAVASATRTPVLPDVPTMAEAGLPGFAIDVWFGVLVPAGTPRAIVDRLNAEINNVLQDQQIVKERLNSVGLSPVGTTPERYMEVMKADLARYAKITRDAGMKAE